MAAQDPIRYQTTSRRVICQGEWDISHLPQLQLLISKLALPQSGEITIDGHAITKMDSSGAWLLCEWQKKLTKKGMTVHLERFAKQTQSLIDIVQKKLHEEESTLPPLPKPLGWLGNIGKYTVLELTELQQYLAFVGRLSFEALRIIPHPSQWRFNSLVAVIYRTGFQGLPIIGILSFLIGVVLAYQMGLQLKNYGANIFIVDLIGLSVLREFGPLITAIMVAGRTGSAFTAQLGMMKLNQEIDALDTMGVTPGELLLLPRIVGLFIALPLLAMWSDIFGILGGMVMSNNMLDITWYDFLQRFPQVIPLKTLLLGLGKTPVFALIIASIGCFQGMQVKNSAESVGLNTTKSVVLSIFFIIVADAIFSVIFSKLKL